MLGRLFENFVIKATNWLFRVASIERVLISSAVFLVAAIYGAPLLIAIAREILRGVPIEYESVVQPMETNDYWILGLCSLLFVAGVWIAIVRFWGEHKGRMRRRAIVLEARGLRDDDGSRLVDEISDDVPGQRVPVLLDLRNRTDGRVIEPERAIDDILAAQRSLLQQQKGVNRSDLTTVYGGLTPVPYTFLTGVLLDDEGSIKVYDWDRTQERWRALDGEDDHRSFEVTGLSETFSTDEVVLAVAFSYPIDTADLETTFTHPVVRLTLQGMSSDAHWSEQKQNRLAQQFLEVIKKLSARAIRRVHLVLAAPNSVVFTFGRRYDKRNLPEVVVYQYERGTSPAYPWGVIMPVGGIPNPNILYSGV